MKRCDTAAAEIIGAIILMAIMSSALAIVGLQWISQIETRTPPYANLEISCGNETATSLFDFSCRTGGINCSEPLKSLDSCKIQCNSNYFDQRLFQKCLDKCMQEKNCADLTNFKNCNMLFICHLGGDSLNIDAISIFINDKKKGPVTKVYNHITISTSIADGLFEIGEIIRFKLENSDIPIKSITIAYTDYYSGNSYIVAKKIFSQR